MNNTTLSNFSQASRANAEAGRLRDTTFDKFGTDLRSCSTPKQALARVGALFDVGETKLFSFCRSKDAKQIPGTDTWATPIDSHKVMWRLDDNRKPLVRLGVVGQGYTVRQPADAAEDLAVFSGEGATFDKGYLSSDSCRLYLRMKVAETRILGDDVMGYCTLLDSYDGSMSLMLFDELVREACKNGLITLVRGSRAFRRKHTKSISTSREVVQAMMNSIRQSLDDLKDLALKTVNIHLSENRWKGIVETLLPFPVDANDKSRRVVEEQRSVLYELINVPDLNNFRNSGWAALNAVSDFSTHLGTSQRKGDTDNQVRKLYEVNEHNPMLVTARDLILASN